METIRVAAGFAASLQQQCPLHMGSQDRLPVVNQAYYGSYGMGAPRMRFLLL